MLASLLPGIRELRAPLAAGYLWLLVGWLAFHSHLPAREQANGVIEALYNLEGLVSALGFGVAVSFAAYLIGSFSQDFCGPLLEIVARNLVRIEEKATATRLTRWLVRRLGAGELVSDESSRRDASTPIGTEALSDHGRIAIVLLVREKLGGAGDALERAGWSFADLPSDLYLFEERTNQYDKRLREYKVADQRFKRQSRAFDKTSRDFRAAEEALERTRDALEPGQRDLDIRRDDLERLDEAFRAASEDLEGKRHVLDRAEKQRRQSNKRLELAKPMLTKAPEVFESVSSDAQEPPSAPPALEELDEKRQAIADAQREVEKSREEFEAAEEALKRTRDALTTGSGERDVDIRRDDLERLDEAFRAASEDLEGKRHVLDRAEKQRRQSNKRLELAEPMLTKAPEVFESVSSDAQEPPSAPPALEELDEKRQAIADAQREVEKRREEFEAVRRELLKGRNEIDKAGGDFDRLRNDFEQGDILLLNAEQELEEAGGVAEATSYIDDPTPQDEITKADAQGDREREKQLARSHEVEREVEEASHLVRAAEEELKKIQDRIDKSRASFEIEMRQIEPQRTELEVAQADFEKKRMDFEAREQNFDNQRREFEKTRQRFLFSIEGPLAHRVEQELDLVAFRLVSDKPELFAEYDRIRSEAQFRMSIIPPLFALVGVLSLISSQFWVMTLLGLGFFYRQAYHKSQAAGDRLADALALGKVQAPTLEKIAVVVTQIMGSDATSNG
jgi:chromosome segregation ATPase